MKPPIDRNEGFVVGPAVYALGLLVLVGSVGTYGVTQILLSGTEVSRTTVTVQREASATRALAAASVLCTGPGETVNGTSCAASGFTPPPPDALPADPQLPSNTSILGTGGGVVPGSVPAPKTDGRGRLFLYCVADSTALSGTTGSIASTPAYAVISAGADGTVDTSCSQALADTPQNDDMIQRTLVSEALDHSIAWNRVSDTEVTFGAGAPSGARVGIGTNTPAEQLDVNGNANVSGNLTVGGSTSLSGGVTTSGDISATNISASNNVIAGGNIAASGSIAANSAAFTNPLPISEGGTGASTTGSARTNLGATPTGDALFTAADSPAARATLGLDDMALQNSGSVAVTGGSISGLTTLDISDGGTDLAVEDGGTGASDAATARANLGADNASNLLSGTVDPSRLPATTGDVGFTRTDATTQDATVVGLQGRPVEATAPAGGEGLGWDSGTSSWKPMVLGVPATGDTGAVSGQHDHDARYYTQTELNTSAAGGAVHWDNVTNKPTFSTSLASLTDTSLASLGDGQVLYYDAGTSSWKNGNVDGVPVGTVAAFDSATCPTGWSDFTPANGRFIVGVGASTDAGGFSETYGLGDSGGENKHQLTVNEMPSHRHDFDYSAHNDNLTLYVNRVNRARDADDSDSSGSGAAVGMHATGGDAAHENRPPYVALRYCKKTVQTTAPLPNAPSVEGLSNTNVSGLQNGQALLWDAANLEWTNADIPSAPLGTVSAFNLATCPSGWRRFTEADGRFIVATGTSSAGGSQTYALGNSGGENAHQLTVSEMPSHRHEFPFDDKAAIYGGTDTDFIPNIWIDPANGNGHLGRAGFKGGDTPHENRPPFYALTLCEKITAPLNPYAEQPWLMSGADTYFDGSVGIGTSSPMDLLHLFRSGAAANVGAIFQNDGRQWRVGLRGDTNQSFAIQDDTAGGLRMVIDPEGDIGLRTANPFASSVTFSGDLFGDSGNLRLEDNSTYGIINGNAYFDGTLRRRNAGYATGIHLHRNDGAIRFFTEPTSGDPGDPVAWQARMTITSKGFVDVGSLYSSASLRTYGTVSLRRNMPADGAQGYQMLQFINEADGSSWNLYQGDPDGGAGVGARAFELWEYPQTGGACCRPRFEVLTSYGQSSAGVLVLRGDGWLGVNVQPTAPLHMYTGAYSSTGGSWINASDRRLKSDIKPLEYGLAEVLDLEPVRYTFDADGSRQIGFVAQDVRKTLPELVTGTEGDVEKGETLGLSYGQMTAVLVNAVKELKAENDDLRARIGEGRSSLNWWVPAGYAMAVLLLVILAVRRR